MQEFLNEKHRPLKKGRLSKGKPFWNIPSFTFSHPPIHFTKYKISFIYL
jgi:hypothetical protein